MTSLFVEIAPATDSARVNQHVVLNDKTNIDALFSLTSVEWDTVYIHDHESLCQSIVDAFVDMLTERGWSGSTYIFNNADC